MRSFACFLALVLGSCGAFAAEPRLQDGDVCRLSLDGPPPKYASDFERNYVIEGGVITLPILGRIPAAGLTRQALAAAIEKRLADGKIFTDPKVALGDPLRGTITVGGGVRSPGPQKWVPGMTLSQAISDASGAVWRNDKIRLVRDGKTTVYTRKAIRKDPAHDPVLRDGDIVDVEGDF